MTRLRLRIIWFYCYLGAWKYALNIAFKKLFRKRRAIRVSPETHFLPLVWRWPTYVARVAFRWASFVGRKLLRLHRRLISHASYTLFDRLRKAENPKQVLQNFLVCNSVRSFSADELSGVLALALECRDYNTADQCVEQLFLSFPLEIQIQRGAAVRSFLQEEYDYADRIHSLLEENRENEFCSRGLDRYRFRYLGPSWFIAIGHIAHLDTLLKHRVLIDAPPANYLPIIPAQLKLPNAYFLDLWKPLLTPQEGVSVPSLAIDDVTILQDEFWSLRVSPHRTLNYFKAGAFVQRAWAAENRGPLLKLPEADAEQGWLVLEKLGVPVGSWFVCLHVRESGFHKGWHTINPGTRNADPATYRQAIDAVVARGGFVVRMGDKSMSPMAGIKGLIDYAHSDAKSEWMDIFLCAKCRFFIGTNSGLGLIPPIFGVPCAMTNWSPIAIPQWYPEDLFIPKLVRSIRENRILTFEEMFTTRAGWAQFEKYFKDNGLEVIDNSPEEIRDLVVEMLERLSGDIDYNGDDAVRLSHFEKQSQQFAGYVGSRMGRDFLRKYSLLLPKPSNNA